ncbi:MAG: hypothetical protein KGK05_05055 [Xanthomonadaceae bacterium]|nr:hypothetical protein [Xanthomonadaceae bacterium]
MGNVEAAARSPTERHLFPWVPIGVAVLIFAGFAQTYYLKPWFASPILPLLLHMHGALMTAWVLLFVAQTRLIAKHRVDLHRRLGIFGAVLMVLVFAAGVVTAVRAAKLGHSPGPPPLVFLIVPLFDIVAFAILVGSALALRRRTDWHRRLMLVATLNILPPATARLAVEYLHAPGLPFALGVTDIAIIGALVYDTIMHRRVHPAFAWGLGLVLFWEAAALALGSTPAWLGFAGWLTGFV